MTPQPHEVPADRRYRDPAGILAWCAPDVPASAFDHDVAGDWWGLLRRLDATLLVSREYEHLLLALSTTDDGQPWISCLQIPHPSGIAVDHVRGRVHVASTRNPNVLYELAPVSGMSARADVAVPADVSDRPLMPVRAEFVPGSWYIHDLVLLDGALHVTAVGHNAVLRRGAGGWERAWWPRCIERADGPVFERNHVQLNSIAAGASLERSFFTATTTDLSGRLPGDPEMAIDGQGVLFSGATREPVVRGLTRPHSARIHGGRTWIDNSGYGEVGFVQGDRFEPLRRLAGWTRGLCFVGETLFVATSRVLPRFQRYAPGIDPAAARCGIHALDVATGRELGRIEWPTGDQIFAVEPVPRALTLGLPFRPTGDAPRNDIDTLFYAYDPPEGPRSHAVEDEPDRSA